MTEIFNQPNGGSFFTQGEATSLTALRQQAATPQTKDVLLALEKLFQEAQQQMANDVLNSSKPKEFDVRCNEVAIRSLGSSHATSGEVKPVSGSSACHPSASTTGDTELTQIRSCINQMRSIKPIARLGTILLLASIFGVCGVLLWPHIGAYWLTGYAVASLLLLVAVDSWVKRPSAQKRSQMLKIIQVCLAALQAPFTIEDCQGLRLKSQGPVKAECRHNELLQELVRIPGLVECDLQNTDLRTIPDLSEAYDLKILNIEGNSKLDFEHSEDNQKRLLSARHLSDLIVDGEQQEWLKNACNEGRLPVAGILRQYQRGKECQ